MKENQEEQAAALLGRAKVSKMPDPVGYALQAYGDREMLELALAGQERRTSGANGGKP